ncbi:MAG: restriction endonuclease [Anaerolineae bacterium]|nr:restriction endonuclease [Anaerolineae bacterium]
MRVVGEYSFNGGKAKVESGYPGEIAQVREIIELVDASNFKSKVGLEKTKSGRMLYSPRALNKRFGELFFARGWSKHKIASSYSDKYYVSGYTPTKQSKSGYREMDFVKNRLGVEVQFGKYAFMVYNVAAKMTIFHNLDLIDAGVEIVPVKEFAREMSTGVAYFEQFTWDLEQRGIANIDIPVLILGIAK